MAIMNFGGVDENVVTRAEFPLEKAREVLLSMKGNVPMLKGIEVGVDLLHSARSYDIILSVILDDMKDSIARVSITRMKNRPSSIPNKNKRRQK